MIFISLNPLSSGNLQFVAQLWFYAQGRWLDKCISQGTWSEPSEANEQQFTICKVFGYIVWLGLKLECFEY